MHPCTHWLHTNKVFLTLTLEHCVRYINQSNVHVCYTVRALHLSNGLTCMQDVDTVLQWCGGNLLEHWGSRVAADQVLSMCPRHEGERLGDPVVGSPVAALESMRDLLLHHTLQLRCNAHAVTAVVGSGRESESPVQCVEQTKLGSALYSSASLLNHSCDPNTIVR